MKRLFHLLLAFSCSLCMSCGSDDKGIDEPDEPVNPENITLELSATDLTLEAEGGKKEFTITCNTDWTITNESSWCQTDVTSGKGNKTVTVTASSSSETADRNTNLTIKAGDKTGIVTVTQKSANAIILSKNKFNLPQEGGNITIEIKNGIDCRITIPADYQAWIKQLETRAAETQSVRFSIAANEDAEKREGCILFSGNSRNDTVFIYQAPKNQLILTNNTYTVSTEGGEFSVELKTNIDYDVQIPGDAASWVSLITTRALRTDRLTFRIEANTGDADRSAKIAIKDKNSNLSDTITFIQPIERADLVWETEQDLIDFKAAGHTRIQGNIIVRGEIKTLQKLDNLLTEIDGSLTLNCTSLTSLDGLYGLTKITGNLIISAGGMTSFEGLENLQTIGGSLKLNAGSSDGYTLNSLTSFKGLSSLKSIGEDLEIKASAYSGTHSLNALKSFEGLENLQTIGGSLKLNAGSSDGYTLNSLTSFKGLSSLKSIGGDLEIKATSYSYSYSSSSYSLNALESFEGLDNLQTIGGSLKLNAESSYYSSSSLNSLTSFKGLSSLKSIGGDLEIKATSYSSSYYSYSLNALKSFEGLDNLQTIGSKKLTIKDCYKLSNIDALGNVEALDEISITGCSALYDFCVLKNVVQNMSGTFYVATCGYNPTKYQFLNGACSQTPPADTDNN